MSVAILLLLCFERLQNLRPHILNATELTIELIKFVSGCSFNQSLSQIALSSPYIKVKAARNRDLSAARYLQSLNQPR